MRTPLKETIEKMLEDGATLQDIANAYNKKSISTIKNWLNKYGLEPNRPAKRLSKTDKDFIQENYSLFGAEYCADALDRSVNSIYKYASSNSLPKNFEWQRLDETELKELYISQNKSIEQIGNILNISPYVVYYALDRYNIPIVSKDRPYGIKHHGWKGYKEISQSHWGDIVRSCKSRGKNRVINFEITIKEAWEIYIEQNRKCAISGVEICFSPTGGDRYKKTTASLDRIDSNQHYSIENCQWLHKKVNMMKMSMSDEEFINWCNVISNNVRGL